MGCNCQKEPVINIVVEEGAHIPFRAHIHDAGADLRSRERVLIAPNEAHFFDTGVHIEVPVGMMAKVENRSSMWKRGLLTTGVLDTGYTGSIGVVLRNLTNTDVIIHEGDKIAQLVLYKIALPEFETVESLEETERGDGGFGSTGK